MAGVEKAEEYPRERGALTLDEIGKIIALDAKDLRTKTTITRRLQRIAGPVEDKYQAAHGVRAGGYFHAGGSAPDPLRYCDDEWPSGAEIVKTVARGGATANDPEACRMILRTDRYLRNVLGADTGKM